MPLLERNLIYRRSCQDLRAGCGHLLDEGRNQQGEHFALDTDDSRERGKGWGKEVRPDNDRVGQNGE